MYDFNFQSASSLDDAADKLSAAEDGTVIAGGQTLIPVLKQRLAKPSDVISLAGAGLSGITNNGDSVTIGAMTTHAAVAASSDVSAVCARLLKVSGMPRCVIAAPWVVLWLITLRRQTTRRQPWV